MIQLAHRSKARIPARGVLFTLLIVPVLPMLAAASTITLPPTTTIGQGQTVDITVSAQPADGIEGADLRVTYDPAVVTPAGDAVATTVSASCMPLTNTSVSGTLQIGLACSGALSGNEVLLKFPLTATAPGSTTLAFSRCDLNETSIPCTPVSGWWRSRRRRRP